MFDLINAVAVSLGHFYQAWHMTMSAGIWGWQPYSRQAMEWLEMKMVDEGMLP